MGKITIVPSHTKQADIPQPIGIVMGGNIRRSPKLSSPQPKSDKAKGKPSNSEKS